MSGHQKKASNIPVAPVPNSFGSMMDFVSSSFGSSSCGPVAVPVGPVGTMNLVGSR